MTDRQAEFETLFAPLLSMAFGTAMRLTRNRAEAEDLVQDAALLAFRGFDSFEQGTNFKAWFFRILTNAFYSRHRKEKHERGHLSTEEVPPLYLYTRTAEAGLHARDPDPAGSIMDRIDTEQVAEALESLPTEYRVVATLISSKTSPTSRSRTWWAVRWARFARGSIAAGACCRRHSGRSRRSAASYPSRAVASSP